MSAAERFRVAFDWRVTALVVLLLPLLVSLGLWQLDRAEEKRQLEALFAQRQAAGPVAIDDLTLDGDLRYQPVRLRGSYLPDRNLLLDNRIHHGRFGYEVVTPFQLADDKRIVLVNRGWLAGDSARRSLPRIDAVVGIVELVGVIHVPQGSLMMLADETATGWPRVVQSIDIDSLRGALAGPLFPYTVRLQPTAPGAYEPNWSVVNLSPQKHTGYAVQWFAMSVALIVIGVLGNTNLWSLLKQRRRGN